MRLRVSRRAAGYTQAIGAAVLASFISLQCFRQPLAPVAPNWDVQLSIPIVDTVYFLKDALKDTNIRISGMRYEYRPAQYNFDAVPIGSRLELNPPTTDTNSTARVGTIKIAPPIPFRDTIRASQFVDTIRVDRPDPIPDTLIVISDTQPTTIDSICVQRPPLPDTCVLTDLPGFQYPRSNPDTAIVLPPNPDIDYVRIESGGMRLRVENRLPVSTLFTTLKLVNANADTIASFPSMTINGRTLKDTTINFAPGTILTSGLTLIVAASSPPTPLPVTFLPGDGIYFEVAVDTLISNEARIRLPAFPLLPATTNTIIVLDDGTYIRRATFRNGFLKAYFFNNTAARDSIRFFIGEFLDRTTLMPYEIFRTIPPNTLDSVTLDLTDYIVQSQTDTSRSITYIGEIQSLEGTGLDTIRNTDGLNVRVILYDLPLRINSVTGRARPFLISVNDTIALPELRLGANFRADSILLQQDTLRILIQTNAGHPVDLYGATMVGFDRFGNVVGRLNVDPTTPPGNGWRFLPGQLRPIEFRQGRLNDFLRNFPAGQPVQLAITTDSTRVNPFDVYNNPSDTGTVVYTDSLHIGAVFIVPLQVAVYNGSFVDTLDIADTATNGERIDPDLLTSIVEGSFGFSMTNTIPVNLSLVSEFLDRADSVILTPDTVRVQNVTTPQIASLRLSRGEAARFNDAHRAVMRLLMGTGGQAAVFDTTQNIRLRIWANLRFNVDPNKLK